MSPAKLTDYSGHLSDPKTKCSGRRPHQVIEISFIFFLYFYLYFL